MRGVKSRENTLIRCLSEPCLCLTDQEKEIDSAAEVMLDSL